MEAKIAAYCLGLDIGYAAVKAAVIDRHGAVMHHAYRLHKGNVAMVLRKIMADILTILGPEELIFGAVTGSGSKRFSRGGGIDCVNEVAAIVQGGLSIDADVASIIEIGGQSAKYITDSSRQAPSGTQISMNSSCAAGTGAFLEEQASRLDLALDEFGLYAAQGNSIPRIAGRCSVFAKTDVTHHLQEGVPLADIVLGLAHAMVRNYRAAVMGSLPRRKPILFAGGVAKNPAIVRALEKELKLDAGTLIVSELSPVAGALGAAIMASRQKSALDLKRLLNELDKTTLSFSDENVRHDLPPLATFGSHDGENKHNCVSIPLESTAGRLKCWLGIDVGSTSTNLVLSDADGCLIALKYLRTAGKPIESVCRGLGELKFGFGETIAVQGVGVTGSGRHLIGRLVGADVVKDEITSQARAAAALDADVDTIFEIGGQDSKYIRLQNGKVTDFQMNKICAAGTGSFLDEQTNKFDIPIEDFGDMALAGEAPTHLGERCTVFMESSVAANLSGGAKREDIAAGLCYAITKNYLNRVVGHKPIGDTIFFQGAVAYNQGVVNAFRALTGREIHVPPFFSVTGAYGVSILAREGNESGKTVFRGFDIDPVAPTEIRKPSESVTGKKAQRFDVQMANIFFQGYNEALEENKKTVGIPRALFTYGMFPMFHAFFKALGFNVLLSDTTSDETVRLGQEYSLDEACYPVKLINGHMAELVRKKVDYIFFPDLYTVDHPGSHTRQNYGCAFMQLAFKVIRRAMDLDAKGIELLSPTIAFNQGRAFMMKQFSDLGRQLHRSDAEIHPALQQAMAAFHAFEARIEENGKAVLSRMDPSKKTFVLISKIYGIADPVLNMGIPERLTAMGYPVLGFHHLPPGDISKEHPNMFWPFGQHILEPAHFIKAHPNLYPILLTHHGCGPDSVLTHYFAELMEGKPYLNIEVDEHASDVGVITRLEAFVNSLDPQTYSKGIVRHPVNIKTDMTEIDPASTLYLTNLYPYSEIFARIIISRGIHAVVLPETDATSIDLGRRHTVTNEYYSLTALLGDVLRAVEDGKMCDNKAVFVIPQNEGAEIDGQANRFIRAKLDGEGYNHVGILAPYMEDVPSRGFEVAWPVFLGLLAGDLIRFASIKQRGALMNTIIATIDKGRFDIEELMTVAGTIAPKTGFGRNGKRILVVGEPLIVFNDFLNDYALRNLEKQSHRVIYAPLAEYMWMLWRDFIGRNGKTPFLEGRIGEMRNAMIRLSECISGEGPFEPDPEASLNGRTGPSAIMPAILEGIGRRK
ncbi:acyl-CoA dehydratase activase [Desulfosarcina cetonica]|uniref:acyl-CoA dehydratase activase n=1 Tax=Desulfosarcina cetonica TaxID=90730 RepID=UPI000AC62555|nr:acyl-CoA dehydratase activase [Desulfosarcina cetonica]